MKTKIFKRIATAAAALSVVLTAACAGNNVANNAKQTEQPAEISYSTQAIELDGVANARQLGGYVCADGKKIKDGVLLRSAALDALTDEGVKTLSDKYKLEYIFDFRMGSEREARPDKEIPGAENLSLPVLASSGYDDETKAAIVAAMASGDPDQRNVVLAKHNGLSSIYKTMLVSDEGKKAYSEFFNKLLTLEDGRAALWHCTQGKDRAGMAAVLLLYALGADDETVKQDYLLTNEAYKDLIEENEAKAAELGLNEDETREFVGLAASVNEHYLDLALESVKTEYDSVINYLKEGLGLSDDDINTLRDKFLE